jgi:hypothetical protein
MAKGAAIAMILPRVRGSFERSDAVALLGLLGLDGSRSRELAEARVTTEGLDVLLDDPRVLNGLLTQPNVGVSPPVVFYVLVRHVLLEAGIHDRITADYLASLIVAFGSENRAYRISGDSSEEFHYFVDLLERLRISGARDTFLIHSHMGNYALWLTGLFPDYIHARVIRRGAPPLRYYEDVGSSGFRGASECPEAGDLGLTELFRSVASEFSALRTALNRFADRHLWTSGGNPVERLLREVAWEAPKD